ncbi:hypothetical protein H8356DRAFT_1436230 [Neocallimastix lanati (nom. inval.)]|nr:hypothetical protein H8356DRAFT_1436230 [Neocallimastix sp. JGI-2020a]
MLYNDYYIISILRKKSDINYNDVSHKIQNIINKLVNDKMNNIYDIIDDDKYIIVFENGRLYKKLEELEANSLRKFINKNRPQKLLKRSTTSTIDYIPIESNLVNHICPVLNYYTVKVYLLKEVVKKVKKLKIFIRVMKSLKLKEQKFKEKYYSVKEQTERKLC